MTPLSHIAEQVVSHLLSIATGACVHFAESLEKLPENLREVRPHIFLGVPRVWEKIQAGMQAAGAQASPLRQRIARWAKGVGLAGGYADQQGRPRPWRYGLAERLVFSKVRERLGFDEARMLVVSAAPIGKETLDYFQSLGLPIMEVYGMSECTGPATMSVPARYRLGHAGFALPGTELRIAADGEILMRGPHVFRGYYKNDEATTQLEMLCKELNFALIFISHENDFEQTRGSRNISKVCDVWVNIKRDTEAESDFARSLIYLTVKKGRGCRRSGPAGRLLYRADKAILEELTEELPHE